MYGKTVRISDDTLNILYKYRIYLCEKFESEGEYFAQKMIEHMSLSDLIYYGIDSLLSTSEKQGRILP